MKITHSDSTLTIGILAKRTGCSVPTIRYYEEIGLLPSAKRRQNGHRIYDATTLELLIFIRQCRDFGFPIEQIRALNSLAGSNTSDCAEARDLAQLHLNKVRTRIVELKTLEARLTSFVQSCTEVCMGGAAQDCTIFKDIYSSVSNQQKPKGCCT